MPSTIVVSGDLLDSKFTLPLAFQSVDVAVRHVCSDSLAKERFQSQVLEVLSC